MAQTQLSSGSQEKEGAAMHAVSTLIDTACFLVLEAGI